MSLIYRATNNEGDGGYIPPPQYLTSIPPIISASIPIIFFHHPPTMLCRKFYKYKGHSLVLHPTLMLTIIGIHYIFDRVDLFYPLKQQLNSVLMKPCR